MNYKNFDPVQAAKAAASTLIQDAMKAAAAAGELPDKEPAAFAVEVPADIKNGDFAANAAMVNAKTFGMPPRKIGDTIAAHINLDGSLFYKVEVAGPGFINLFLADTYFCEVVKAAVSEGENYGRTNFGAGKKVMVEFVSANPTGPMHLGNARGGALGDCLASSMDWAGYDVTREFYINDAGNQIEKFGKSLSARYLQQHLGEDAIIFPEDGYQGEDIKVRAAEFTAANGDKYVNASEEERKQALIDFALPQNIANLKRDLAKYRIEYDVWFPESTLHSSGEVQRVVDLLVEKGAAYKAEDGAVMYRSAEYSATYGAANKKRDQDEVKDEVLVRANGIPTYFAADIAYHYNKFATRGFDTCIDVWGADHHGHVARMKGAMDAVGLDGTKLDVILMQLVNLMKDGVPVRMSKRTGKAVTLSDLLDEVPIDSTRFFFNMREAGSAMDFDLDLAAKEDSDNPVYYVQYAHARICSILKALASEGISPVSIDDVDLSLLKETAERELVRHISYFPGEIISAAKNYDPARITRYVIELATMYHKFYNSCRVKDAEDTLRQARMALCIATKNTLHNALVMLKISVPESM